MKIPSIIGCLGLFTFALVTQAFATYPDQDQYQEIYNGLRQSDHPWANKFMGVYDQITDRNRQDLRQLAEKIQEVSDEGASKKNCSHVIEKLSEDKALSLSLKEEMLAQGKKFADNWPLFTGLNKMIGVGGITGIYDDAQTWIHQDATILYDVNRQPLCGNQFSVLKTIGLYGLLEARNLETLSGPDAEDIRSILNIYAPNVIFNDVFSAKEIAKNISLSDISSDDIVTLWKPSASYEFGGNNSDHFIWDCSSLEAFIADFPWRFSTSHQEMAWRQQMDELNMHVLLQTDISEKMWAEFNNRFRAVYADEELKTMDIVVWRKYRSSDNVSCAGHTGFFVGQDPVNADNILLAESNRFDDKSYEGIGIRSVSFNRPNEDGFYWRTFVLRQK